MNSLYGAFVWEHGVVQARSDGAMTESSCLNGVMPELQVLLSRSARNLLELPSASTLR